MTWRGSGRGKLILVGEHAVVYGHPAIAIAVDRGTSVELTAIDGPTRLIDPPFQDDRLLPGILSILPAEGLGVQIRTELPIGRGMGSSAALAVGLIRANAERLGESLDEDTTWERAMVVERCFHGNPSGLDHAVSARGGVVRYLRPPPGKCPVLYPLPWPIGLRLVVLDTGIAGDTKELVAGVASRRPAVDPDLDAIGLLVPEVEAVLRGDAGPAAQALGPLFDKAHERLLRIGVSTSRIEAIRALANGSGAWGCKLAGAGGGGVLIAVHPDPDELVATAFKAGIAAFTVGAAGG